VQPSPPNFPAWPLLALSFIFFLFRAGKNLPPLNGGWGAEIEGGWGGGVVWDGRWLRGLLGLALPDPCHWLPPHSYASRGPLAGEPLPRALGGSGRSSPHPPNVGSSLLGRAFLAPAGICCMGPCIPPLPAIPIAPSISSPGSVPPSILGPSFFFPFHPPPRLAGGPREGCPSRRLVAGCRVPPSPPFLRGRPLGSRGPFPGGGGGGRPPGAPLPLLHHPGGVCEGVGCQTRVITTPGGGSGLWVGLPISPRVGPPSDVVAWVGRGLLIPFGGGGRLPGRRSLAAGAGGTQPPFVLTPRHTIWVAPPNRPHRLRPARP